MKKFIRLYFNFILLMLTVGQLPLLFYNFVVNFKTLATLDIIAHIVIIITFLLLVIPSMLEGFIIALKNYLQELSKEETK